MRTNDLARPANLKHAVKLVDEMSAFFCGQVFEEMAGPRFGDAIVLERPAIVAKINDMIDAFERPAVYTDEAILLVVAASEIQFERVRFWKIVVGVQEWLAHCPLPANVRGKVIMSD